MDILREEKSINMKIDTLETLIDMAEFCYKHSLRNAAHSEFLKEDRQVIKEAKAELRILKSKNYGYDTLDLDNI